MADLAKTLGIVPNERKNFYAFLKAQKLEDANEYRPLYDKTFHDGSFVNIRNDKKTIVVYNIKPGDTLSQIAENFKEHGVTLQELIRANGIKNVDKIKADQFLALPFSEEMRDDQDTVNLYTELK